MVKQIKRMENKEETTKYDMYYIFYFIIELKREYKQGQI